MHMTPAKVAEALEITVDMQKVAGSIVMHQCFSFELIHILSVGIKISLKEQLHCLKPILELQLLSILGGYKYSKT